MEHSILNFIWNNLSQWMASVDHCSLWNWFFWKVFCKGLWKYALAFSEWKTQEENSNIQTIASVDYFRFVWLVRRGSSWVQRPWEDLIEGRRKRGHESEDDGLAQHRSWNFKAQFQKIRIWMILFYHRHQIFSKW